MFFDEFMELAPDPAQQAVSARSALPADDPDTQHASSTLGAYAVWATTAIADQSRTVFAAQTTQPGRQGSTGGRGGTVGGAGAGRRPNSPAHNSAIQRTTGQGRGCS